MVFYSHCKHHYSSYCPSQAKRCGDPTLLYKHMLEREVGTQHALVYSAYASALEARGDKEEAVGILELGVAKGAHPVKRLQKQLE